MGLVPTEAAGHVPVYGNQAVVRGQATRAAISSLGANGLGLATP